MHENRETPWPTCKRKRQSGRRRRKPHVRHAQQWGVGWRSSTDEAVEQSHGTSARGSGEGGGKGVNQGERPAGTRGPGTARSSGVTGSDGRAESGQGEEAGTVHYVAAPSDCQSAAGQLLRTET